MNDRRWVLAIAIFGVLATLLGVWLRFYWLSYHGDKRIFDEVYFPIFAHDYIQGKEFFDVHPPLGKLLIALGELVFGDNGLGWRIVPCLFGLANIGLMAVLYRRLFKENVGAWALAGFLALDGMFIAYSRTGLMDGILFFATFFCVYAAARLDKDKLPGLLTAVALGLAVSIKWTALSAIIPMLWFASRYGRLKPFFAWLPLGALLYLSIVVFGQWRIGAAHPIVAAFHWHKDTMIYQVTLDKTHPWGSPWWSWPIEMRPVLLIYDKVPGGAHMMSTIANPILVWGSTLTILGTMVFLLMRRREAEAPAPLLEGAAAPAEPGEDPVPETQEPAPQGRISSIVGHPTYPLLLGFFASWLPFAPVHRVMFFYHYMPAYGFGLLLIAYWIGRLAKRWPAAAFAVCVGVAVMAWWEMPFALGYPKLTDRQIAQRVIVPRWL